MIRSVLKATPQQLQYIQSQMPTNNQKAKQGRREFKITFIERAFIERARDVSGTKRTYRII